MVPSPPIFYQVANAPAPVAPYSHAVEQGGWLFVTGQMPFIGKTPDSPYPEGIEAQTHQVFSNLKDVLDAAGLAFADVVMARVYLSHFERDYDGMNGVYKTYFASDRYPARTCVGVTGLAQGALVEIDLVARRST